MVRAWHFDVDDLKFNLSNTYKGILILHNIRLMMNNAKAFQNNRKRMIAIYRADDLNQTPFF